jgi:hypothetical protein
MSKRKPTQQSELSEVANIADAPIAAFGRKYKIAKFNLRQLAQAMEYAGYIGVLIIQAMKLKKDAGVEEVIGFVTQGIGVSSPAFIPIISIATGEPVEWLEEQDDALGALEIFVKVVEKNRDFFTQENIEKVKRMFGALLPQTQEAGTDSLVT